MIVLIFILLYTCLFFINTSSDDAREVAIKYAKSFKNFDSERIVSVFHEKMILESYDSKDDMIEYFNQSFESLKKGNYKINSYSVSKEYQTYKEQKLGNFLDELNDEYGISKSSVKEIRCYTITFYIINDNNKSTSVQEAVIANIDGHWYYLLA